MVVIVRKGQRDAARVALMLAALVGPVVTASAQSSGQTDPSSIIRITSTAELPLTRNLVLAPGRALIFELPVDVQDAIISNPAALDATVLTPRRVMLFSKNTGVSNVFLLGRDGRRLAIFDVNIRKDQADLGRILTQVLPGARIRVQQAGGGLVLTGTVAQPADAARAGEIAEQFLAADTQTTGAGAAAVGSSSGSAGGKVINLITTGAKEQVMLKVVVAELQRDAMRRIGVNLPEALIKAGDFTFTKVMANGFPITGGSAPSSVFNGPGSIPGIGSGSVVQGTADWKGNSISAMLEAFERAGVARTLAEPTLIAMSGEPARFHAGGEMPVPVAQQNNTISVTFKPFGVSLAFTPFVLSEGRISLKVAAEVSELSSQGAVTSQGISLQGIQVRKAETVVEMPSGSALAMAGMLSEQTRRSTDGVPELQNLPILGSLFRSKDFRNSQSELVILVTPYLVKPTEPQLLAKPNEGRMPVVPPPTPLRSLLISHLNRVYSHVPAESVRGGYVVDAPSRLKE
jgi:pilus assembly protein CpaC